MLENYEKSGLNLINRFYSEHLGFIQAQIARINAELATLNEIYLTNINKRNETFTLAKETINALLTEKRGWEDDQKRISQRDKADTGLVRWH